MFFYRLGHIPELATAEFISLTNSKNFKFNSQFLISSSDLDISKTGSLVYKGNVFGNCTDTESIVKCLYELYQSKPSKKLGISINAEINSKELIKIAKEIGFKKINLLIGKEPNAGHFKDISDWVVVFDFYGETTIAVITDSVNQDIFSNLDMGLPGGNMKRGKMNLKLALSLLNLADNKNSFYWDPFVGQGGLVLIDLLFNQKPIVATDFDRTAIRDMRLNLDWISKKYPDVRVDKNVLHIEKMDAATLAKSSLDSNLKGVSKKINQKFDFNQTAIVTEGFLGPVYGFENPTRKTLESNLEEIQTLWRNVFSECQKLEIPEIVFCLPAYKVGSSDILRVDIDKSLTGLDYKLMELNPGKYFVDYSRAKSKVIHQIQKVILSV